MELEYGVCLEGALVTREMAERWPEPDALRAAALVALDAAGRDDLTFTDADAHDAVTVAADLKRSSPEELVTVCVWRVEAGR